MAGRAHDYPEQFAAGLAPHAVKDKYYYARRPEVNRVVDVSGVVDQMIDANRANRAKGPAGNHSSRLRAELARRGQKLPLLGDDDVTADRNYIREFLLARRRALRPTEEYRTPTDDEWAEFLGHFERRIPNLVGHLLIAGQTHRRGQHAGISRDGRALCGHARCWRSHRARGRTPSGPCSAWSMRKAVA